MVVLSDVKRRKRTWIGGMGARGRRLRYSSRKMAEGSGDTNGRIAGRAPGFRCQDRVRSAKISLAREELRGHHIALCGVGAREHDLLLILPRDPLVEVLQCRIEHGSDQSEVAGELS